jgi:hypothetical protein
MPEPNPPPRFDAELLRTFLAQRDALCPTCNYNLRGLAAERCPECAADLSLSLSSIPILPRRRRAGILLFAWLILVAALAEFAFGLYWELQYLRAIPGTAPPAYYIIRQGALVVVALGVAITAAVAILTLGFSSRRRDDRYRRCFFICVVAAAIHILAQIIDYLSYMLFR